MNRRPIVGLLQILSVGLLLAANGCTSVREYVQNGFKVGPNHQSPPAPTESAWIDSANPRVKSDPGDLGAWWSVFGDPVLNDLVKTASSQNVNLRIAASR